MRLVLSLTLVAAAVVHAQPRIRIGPDVLVSRNTDVQHAEVWIAAHPTDADKLVGMSVTLRDIASKVMLELYATSDGGNTWTPSIPAHQLAKGGGDPIVGISQQGTALGVALGDRGMWVYRSEDDGITWDAGRRASNGADHERLAIDYSSGPFAGRMYLAGEVGDGRATPDSIKRAVNVWRSLDDGRTWLPPVTVARDATHGVAVDAFVVMSDGTLALFLDKYPNPGKDMTTPTWEILLTTSSNGGVTFTTPQPIGTQTFGGYADFRKRQNEGRMDLGIAFDAAVDTRGSRFRDRMYVAYTEVRSPAEGGRLVARWSSDRGKTWSAPKDIVPETRARVSQFQPAVAVNKDGTVGVLWYDTRDAQGQETFDVFFTASTDGGETWAAPARVSSMSSWPFTAGNDRPVAIRSTQSASGTRVTLISAFSRWPDGGDYIGLTADAGGVFHPFWADSRSGTYQVYSSRVEVAPAGVALAGAPPSERRTLNEQVTINLDPIAVDWQRSELLIPVRLKNTSRDTVYGPIMVQVKAICAQRCGAADSATVLNASNGARSAGAVVDYSPALRDFGALAPGAVSAAVVWRIKPASMRHTDLMISVEVTGQMKPATGDGRRGTGG
jgi:hypothetical protein